MIFIKTGQSLCVEWVCQILKKNIYNFGILMKKCTKYLSAIKICDVAGTPSLHTSFSIINPVGLHHDGQAWMWGQVHFMLVAFG